MLTIVLAFSNMSITRMVRAESTDTYSAITSADELVSGKYVVVASNNKALGTVSSNWVLSVDPQYTTDGKITNADGYCYTVTVNEDGSVYLCLPNGKYLARSGSKNNVGEVTSPYAWTVTFGENGFRFHPNDDSARSLAYNGTSGSEKFRQYADTTISGQPNTYYANFTLYKLDEQPEDPPFTGLGLIPKLSDLVDGDTVVIYNPTHGTALGSTIYNDYYFTGVATTIEDDKVVNPDGTTVWTVSIADGVYTFTQGTMKISAWLNGNYVELSNDPQYASGWTIEAFNEENHTFKVYSSTLTTSYGNAYLEAYTKSGVEVFSGYSTGESNVTEANYGLQFYRVEYTEPDTPVDPPVDPPVEKQYATLMDTLPNDGDQIIIHHISSNMALGSAANGVKLAAVSATPEENKLPIEEGTAVLTVQLVSEGKYAFVSDGKYLTSAQAGNGLSFESTLTELGQWEFETKGDKIVIHNVGANYNETYNQYLEYYSGAFTTYGIKNTATSFTAYQMNLYLVKAAVQEGLITDLADLADGDTVVIYNPGNAKALSSTMSGSWYLTAMDATISEDKVVNPDATLVWTVSISDGVYTFTQGTMTISAWLSGTYVELSNSTTYDNGWNLSVSSEENHTFYMYSSTLTTSYGNAYIETFTKSGELVFCGYSTGTSKLSDKNYGMQFYRVKYEEPAPTGGLPNNGDAVVIYNADAEGVFGLINDMGNALTSVAATIEDGKAVCGNGARVFHVERSGDEFKFVSDGQYLATNDAEDLFFTDTNNDYATWTLEKRDDGYIMYNKAAKYNNSKVCIEYYSGSYSGWTFKSSSASIFEFNFYPVADGTVLTGDVVNKPEVTFNTTKAYINLDYTFSFAIDAIFGIEGDIKVTVNGTELTFDENYNVVVPAEMVTGESLVIRVTGKDTKGVDIIGETTVEVADEPVIRNITPSRNSETGDNKRPTIGADVFNAGENPTVVMTVNGVEVTPVVDGTSISYTPAEDMADGKVTVTITVTRADEKTAKESWSFTVGTAQFQLYFGQLHSHTAEYSDGSGTLAQALQYIQDLPDSANIQFVAFTDHSNYFDKSGAANPEAALYDMSQATAFSQDTWASYNNAINNFNEAYGDSLLALAGFEMTWSGGPGHMNTWNTPGIVSRNNTTLNNKTNNAGLQAYYSLLSQEAGVDSISQFNHPGTTFGTFIDFSYYDAVIDTRIYLLEVGNGEGAIGSGGYYPSYEEYIKALDKGWHVAPTNNQDNHKGHWGNANDARDVILTDDFSVEGLYSAIRQYRVYATEDKNLEIQYTVNDYMLGSIIEEVPDSLDIKVSVYDPDYADSISKVEVVVNSGKTVYSWTEQEELSRGELEVTLPADYSYYFIRVTEGDGDLAVTAPVWVGDTLKLGISDFASGTSTPVTNEEIELTTTLFNSEAGEATIKSLTYTVDGSTVIGTDTTGYTMGSAQTKAVKFNFTPTLAKIYTITVTAVVELDGKEYTFTKDLTLDVLDAEQLVYIGIDASHYNEYVAGNYADNMGNFSQLAAEYSVRTVELKTSEELIAACSNPKYVAMIFTAPSRRLAAAQSDPRTYSDAELAAITEFNNNGGVVIVAGWSDYYENYDVITSNQDIKHMAEAQNDILQAIGSTLRINDDATVDDELNGGQSQRLYFSSYNYDNFLLEGVEYDPDHPNDRMYTEVFSQYGGCSIYMVEPSRLASASIQATNSATVNPNVTTAVFGHSSTYTKDSDGDGKVDKLYPFADGDDRVLVLATEANEGKGMVIASGAAFMSNFEVQATVEDSNAEKNYSNYKVCENLLKMLNPVKVTDIDTVRSQTEAGYKFVIEGIVTSNASGYDRDTAFFDCIYVQDETGGINCFPVAGDFKIGDKVRVTGVTDFYQGEIELQVSSIERIGTDYVIAPTEVTSKDINDLTHLGELITVNGTVVSFGLENGLVQTIMVKDANGDVCRVFIDGYITIENEVQNLEVGCNISVTGISSYDDTFNAPDGPFLRIRIRNRADVICTVPDTGVVNPMATLMITSVASACAVVYFVRKKEEFFN